MKLSSTRRLEMALIREPSRPAWRERAKPYAVREAGTTCPLSPMIHCIPHFGSTETTGNGESFAGDPRGIVRRKECRHCSNVLRLSDAAQRCLRFSILVEFANDEASRVRAFCVN